MNKLINIDSNSISKYKFFIFDIETNGIIKYGNFNQQRPIQISYQLIDSNGNLLKSNSYFIKGVEKIEWPKKIGKCPWSVEYINENGTMIDIIVEEFINILSDEKIIIVAHNIDFDINCLCNFIKSEKLISLFKKSKKICTMKSTINFCKLFNKYTGKNNKYPKLSELANKLNIDTYDEKFHNSKYDVEITKQCFIKLYTVKENIFFIE